MIAELREFIELAKKHELESPGNTLTVELDRGMVQELIDEYNHGLDVLTRALDHNIQSEQQLYSILEQGADLLDGYADLDVCVELKNKIEKHVAACQEVL